MSRARAALIGVGNCASAFTQGLAYYSGFEREDECIGLRHLFLGDLHPRDVEIVAAFDVDSRKVGSPLSEAIFAEPNNTLKLADVPKTEVLVRKGPLLDGIGEYTRDVVQLSDLPDDDVADVLRGSGAEIVISLLPSGAVQASHWYAEEALKAGCAFVNATPVSLASDPEWAERFKSAGLPLVGDDLVDQVGATTLHKTLLRLLSAQGVRIEETYQLDVGGGTESLDTLERTREVKRVLKTKSVQSALPYKAKVVAGSTDYVDFLRNRRDSYFWIRGLHFCEVPLEIDLRLSTVDAPNAGSVLLDVVRSVKIALRRELRGVVLPISAYAFKNPPQLLSLADAERAFTSFLELKP